MPMRLLLRKKKDGPETAMPDSVISGCPASAGRADPFKITPSGKLYLNIAAKGPFITERTLYRKQLKTAHGAIRSLQREESPPRHLREAKRAIIMF